MICFKAFKELHFPSKLLKKADDSLQIEENEDEDKSTIKNKENIVTQVHKEGLIDGKLFKNLKYNSKQHEDRGGLSIKQRNPSINTNKMADVQSIKNPFKPKLQKMTRFNINVKAFNQS